MKKKTIVSLIVIVAIVSVVIFAGCIEDKEPQPTVTPTPTPKKNRHRRPELNYH